jgi:hypothetical protein
MCVTDYTRDIGYEEGQVQRVGEPAIEKSFFWVVVLNYFIR